jgi:hypothetical protein
MSEIKFRPAGDVMALYDEDRAAGFESEEPAPVALTEQERFVRAARCKFCDGRAGISPGRHYRHTFFVHVSSCVLHARSVQLSRMWAAA